MLVNVIKKKKNRSAHGCARHREVKDLLSLLELEDEIIVLRAERTKLDNAIEALRIERDEAIAHRDIAIRERGELAFRLLNL
ncbi:hypothetical protein N7497_011521 [Penicillium chrysogenum]|nr:hypothetical protein N7497_011521 [Penicillium chrysogenum]